MRFYHKRIVTANLNDFLKDLMTIPGVRIFSILEPATNCFDVIYFVEGGSVNGESEKDAS